MSTWILQKTKKNRRPARSRAANPKPLPSRRDATQTRDTILRWATQCFAQAGFHGTSLSEILAKARINKRMIYHYFESKLGLYRAVHAQQWQALETWFAQKLSQSSQGGPSSNGNHDLLIEVLSIFHDFMASHQLFVRLLLWDGLEGGMASRSLWKDARGPLYQRIVALVYAAQKKRRLDRDLQANHLIVSFIGAISFYFAYAPSLEDILDEPALSSSALARRKEQIVRLFEKICHKTAMCRSVSALTRE